uniref:Uncharacterized protein n=1 Tax=Romanomermis culicivorax TaxID=13658 RepID=A0A915IC57_ROMCU
MDVDIDISTQVKADQEMEEEARCDYVRREQAFQMAQGTGPPLPSEPPKSQLNQFLENVVSQAWSNEYILGTELTSQDVYGQETTTPGGEMNEPGIQLTQPKAETAKESDDTEKLTKVIVEETPWPMVAASLPHSTARVEESDESDYVVEVEDKISTISDEDEATEKRPGRINQPQIQATMAKSSLMEMECSMIIAASFGMVRPTGAPQISPSTSIC